MLTVDIGRGRTHGSATGPRQIDCQAENRKGAGKGKMIAAPAFILPPLRLPSGSHPGSVWVTAKGTDGGKGREGQTDIKLASNIPDPCLSLSAGQRDTI